MSRENVDPWDPILRIEDAVATAREEMSRSRGGANFATKELDCIRARFGSETLCLTVIREHLNHAQVASRILGWLREER